MILFLILIAEYPVTIKTMITFLLTNDKLKLPMHLRQPDFGPIAKTTDKVKKIKETGDSTYICRNRFDKPYFQYKLGYANKDFQKGKYDDNILRDNAFRWVSKWISIKGSNMF